MATTTRIHRSSREHRKNTAHDHNPKHRTATRETATAQPQNCTVDTFFELIPKHRTVEPFSTHEIGRSRTLTTGPAPAEQAKTAKNDRKKQPPAKVFEPRQPYCHNGSRATSKFFLTKRLTAKRHGLMIATATTKKQPGTDQAVAEKSRQVFTTGGRRTGRNGERHDKHKRHRNLHLGRSAQSK